jgi:hypothetical protein
LPEEITLPLFHVWLADSRGESFPVPRDTEELVRAQQEFLIWIKETGEAAEREGGLDREVGASAELDDLAPLLSNYWWLLRRDKLLNFRGAHLKMCEIMRRGTENVASAKELDDAYRALKSEICCWLDYHQISFQQEQSLFIPATAVRKSLAEFEKRTDIYFAPEIPVHKLENASNQCALPTRDSVAVLIDCTFWGSAKDAAIFGTRGLYYHNAGIYGFLPYREFPNRTFNMTIENSMISLGSGQKLNLSGSGVTPSQMLGMLEALKREAGIRRNRNTKPNEDGLGSLPGM